MKVYDLFDMDVLDTMLREGLIRSQTHPAHPQLVILNYTETCAYQRVWNGVTTACRGLIYDTSTGEVLARPFPKFFNWGEPGAPEFDMNTQVEVTDKLDGSLGILHPLPNGQWAIATRGSFDSEQARHATGVWRQRYAHYVPPQGMTILMEIVYPANRIVCDYGATDDLYLLGAVDIKYGDSYGPWESEGVGDWPARRVSEMRHITTLGEALAQPPRPGAEGMVLRRWHSEDRIKIKQDDYVQLHRIITGCTARRLWEQLVVWEHHEMTDKDLTRRFFLGPQRIQQIRATGPEWLDDYLEKTPEEFRGWVEAKIKDMAARVSTRESGLRDLFTVLCQDAGIIEVSYPPSREDSKRFAALVRDRVDEPTFHLIMVMWRGHSVSSAVWREVYPEHELPYRVTAEEA